MDITLGDGAEINIRAWMMFPDKDDAYRKSWVKVVKAGIEADVVLQSDIARKLTVEAISNERLIQGFTTGAELALLFFDLSDGASANKIRKTIRDNGGALPMQNRTFEKHAKTFRSVRHLWAAFAVITKKGSNGTDFVLGDDLEKFLYIAHDMKLFWADYKTKMNQSPPEMINFQLSQK